jgi:hypothetical protein
MMRCKVLKWVKFGRSADILKSFLFITKWAAAERYSELGMGMRTRRLGFCGTVYSRSCSASQMRILLEGINQRQSADKEPVSVGKGRLFDTYSWHCNSEMIVRDTHWNSVSTVHDCESRCLALREESRLRMFETKELRIISGSKRDEISTKYRRKTRT